MNTYSGGVFDVAFFGNFAYMLSGDLQIMDISDPASPEHIGFIGGWGDLAISGSHVYIAAGRRFFVVPIQCDDIVAAIDDDYLDPEPNDIPQAMVNLSVHPNPFNPRTTITFSIDHPQSVELCIFDMTGKRIAELANREFETGFHSMEWQGKDLQGRAVASGTYLLRMSTDEWVTSEKMMLVR
jgi:hypothetical protein